MAMVVRANKNGKALGGSYRDLQFPISSMYEVGFDWFFPRSRRPEHGADMVYFQGHSSPGVYARAFCPRGGLGRGARLALFRQEGRGARVFSSYPHPWADAAILGVPDGVPWGWARSWAIYQARVYEIPAQPEVQALLVIARCGCSWVTAKTDEPESPWCIVPWRRGSNSTSLFFVVKLQLTAPRRAGAGQRQDHSGAGRPLPGGRLECDQADSGAASGILFWNGDTEGLFTEKSSAAWSMASFRDYPCPGDRLIYGRRYSATIPAWVVPHRRHE